MSRAAIAVMIIVAIVAASVAAYMLVPWHKASGTTGAATATSTARHTVIATSTETTVKPVRVEMVHIVDALGRRVAVPPSPTRIAVIDDEGGLLLTLDAVTGGEALRAIVAWSAASVREFNPAVYEAYASLLQAAKETSLEPNATLFKNLGVQLILVSKSVYERSKGSILARLSGIPVVVLDVSPSGVEQAIRIIAEVWGVEERAEKLTAWMRSVERMVSSRLSDIIDYPSVYLLEPASSVWSELLEAAGGRSNETSPDALIIASTSITGSVLKEELSRLNDTPAARHWWACSIYSGLAYGPWWPLGLEALAKALHPAVFRDINVTSDIEEFVNKWLSVKPRANWLMCLEPPRHRVTIIDAAGREVTLKAPARRIIVLYGLEDLVAVSGEYGLAHLVALNKYRYMHWRPDWWKAWIEHFPWLEKLPDVGQPGYSFNPELILRLRPDALIVARFMWQRLVESGWAQKFQQAGIPVIVIDFVPPTTNVTEHLEAVKRSLLALGAVTGYTDRAVSLYKLYEQRLLYIVKNAEKASKKPKVLVLATWAQWRAYGRGGMYQVWITFAGGVNIAGNIIPGTSGDINPEYVLKANPDVIIFTCNNNVYTSEGRRQEIVIGYTVNSTTPAKRLLKMLVNRPGWDKLNAVREGRVYLIHHGLSHGHVFQFVALEWIAKWLHPEIFESLDPLHDFKMFYAKYMPFSLRGVWAVGIRDP